MIATIAGIWLLGSALLWTAKKLEDHPAPFWIVIAFWPVLLVAFIGFVLWEVVDRKSVV